MRTLKRTAALFIAFLFTIVLPLNAFATSNESAVLEYLQTFNKEITTDSGDSIVLTYNLDEMTEEEIKYIVSYITTVGIDHFEEEVFGDTSEIQIQKGSTAPIKRAFVSTYVNFPTNGNKKYSNSRYVLISLGSGHTMEYTEDISITVICSGGVVTGIKSFSFNLGSLPSYGSYSIDYMSTNYTSNSAALSATYTITKTIEASVGEISVPIAQYSTKTSASLLLLKAV